MWLVDKSALVRIPQSHEATVWSDRIERGLVRISAITRLEIGYSARSGVELRAGATSPPIVLTLLHLDKDFDLIASLTGQPTERVIPAQ